MADKFFIEKETKKGESVHAKHNFAWVLGCIVLLLVAITFVFPATGIVGLFTNNSLVFGSFAGEKIEYKEDSVMYRTVQQYSNMFQGGNQDFMNQYIFSWGYNSAVMQAAAKYYASKSGYAPSKEEVDDTIFKQYTYEDGTFARDHWGGLSSSSRKAIRASVSEGLTASRFMTDISNIEQNNKNFEFVKSYIPNAKNFSAIVFIGDDAEQNSAQALEKLKNKEKIDDVAKSFEKTVVKIENVMQKSMSFLPESNNGGDVGKFYESLTVNEGLKEKLFALKAGELYNEVISVKDKEKIVVISDGDITDEKKTSNESRVESQMNYNPQGAFETIIMSSKLHKNNFEKTYNKYFKPRAEENK